MTLKSRSVIEKRTKRHLVSDCLRATAGFGVIVRKLHNDVAFFGDWFSG